MVRMPVSGQRRIDAADHRGDAGGDVRRRAGRLHREGRARPWDLPERHLDLRLRLAPGAVVDDVGLDPDDLPRHRVWTRPSAAHERREHDALADRIDVRQVSPDEGLVDGGDARAAGAIVVGQRPAADRGDAEGAVVARRHHVDAAARPHRTPDDLEPGAEAGALHRDAGGHGHRGDAGQRLRPLEERPVERLDLAGRREPGARDRQLERDLALGMEAEVGVHRAHQRVHGHAAAGEQRQRQRELDDDQRAAQAVAAGADRSAAFLHDFGDVGPARAPRRGQARPAARRSRRCRTRTAARAR